MRSYQLATRVFGFVHGVRAWATLGAIIGPCMPARSDAPGPRRGDAVVVTGATPVTDIIEHLHAGCSVFRLYRAGWARISGVAPVMEPVTALNGPVLWAARGRGFHREYAVATRAVQAIAPASMVIPGRNAFFSALHLRAEAEGIGAEEVLLHETVRDAVMLTALDTGLRPLVFDEQAVLCRVTGIRLRGHLYRNHQRRARAIGRTACGAVVFNTARRVSRAEFAAAQLVIAGIDAGGAETVAVERSLRDFRLSGDCAVVTRRADDDVTWAVPMGREHAMPLAPSRKPRRSSRYTVVLRRAGAVFIVIDAHWGPRTPVLPSHPGSTAESDVFWAEHVVALRPLGVVQVPAATPAAD